MGYRRVRKDQRGSARVGDGSRQVTGGQDGSVRSLRTRRWVTQGGQGG